MKRVLFIGTKNSGRSQMAEAIVNHHYKGRIEAKSAGVNPQSLDKITVEVLNEIGIDICGHESHKPEDFKNESFDYVITLCDQSREQCPVFWTQGEAIYNHINIFDPSKQGVTYFELLKAFRETRDEIEDKVTQFFDKELEWDKPNRNKILHHPVSTF
ncbi:MAG: arsenate reductase ArsC [Firmicutes bacterium]|nr:arsenate reductase ArsC [Bacillota bacterium]